MSEGHASALRILKSVPLAIALAGCGTVDLPRCENGCGSGPKAQAPAQSAGRPSESAGPSQPGKPGKPGHGKPGHGKHGKKGGKR